MDLQAAVRQGDESTIDLYHQATKELTRLVIGIKNQLSFDDGVNVSFSGSLFKEEPLILRPFSELIGQLGGIVVKPIYSPVVGAMMLAIDSTKE